VTAKAAVKKKTPAQAKAAKAYAAAGRAAQAKKRAAAIKATGKPPPRTKAQKAAAIKWAKAGQAAQAAAKAGKKAPALAKKAALPTHVSNWTGPAIWLPGCNDQRPTCVSVAVANHLLESTGIAATDAMILKLHEYAGGDDGATIPTVLEAASCYGLAGIKLSSYGMANEILPGLVCGIETRRGYHAALSHPYGLVSWGFVMPHFGEPQEAWALNWDLDHA
jgi:hypothetical protein